MKGMAGIGLRTFVRLDVFNGPGVRIRYEIDAAKRNYPGKLKDVRYFGKELHNFKNPIR